MIFWATWGGHSEAECCSKDVVQVGHPVLMGDAERPSQYSGSTLFLFLVDLTHKVSIVSY